MRLLLDTHPFLWWVSADRRLSKPTRELIASPENQVAVSAATFWEIAIKIGLRRIDVDLGELVSALSEDAFEELPVRARHTLTLTSLPALHSDPFDRLLIAQAITEGYKLVTRDESILAYDSVAGFDSSLAVRKKKSLATLISRSGSGGFLSQTRMKRPSCKPRRGSRRANHVCCSMVRFTTSMSPLNSDCGSTSSSRPQSLLHP